MTKYGIDTVMTSLAVAKHPVNLCILGGEPTIAHMFDYTVNLSRSIKNIKTIRVFTNGSRRLKEIDGVTYIVSIHPDFFKDSYIKNFKDIFNKQVKVMFDPRNLKNVKLIIDVLTKNGIQIVADYIHYGNKFDLGPKIHTSEDALLYNFNGSKVSLRSIMEDDLWDARNFRCFQNEISIAPNMEIQRFCSPYKTYDPSFLAKFKIKLTPCQFKKKCMCFEQVKI